MSSFSVARNPAEFRQLSHRTDETRLTTGTAARVLQVSPQHVRRFVSSQQLRCERTRSGMRLFQAADVLELADQRARATLNPLPPISRVGGQPRQLRLRLFRTEGRKAR